MGRGEPDIDGVAEGVPDAVRLAVEELVEEGESERDAVGVNVLEADEPPLGELDGVAGAGVVVGDTVGVAEGVFDGDGEFDLVPVGDSELDLVPDPDGVCVKVGVGVPLGRAPADGVPVCDGVWLGDACTTPAMKKGEP